MISRFTIFAIALAFAAGVSCSGAKSKPAAKKAEAKPAAQKAAPAVEKPAEKPAEAAEAAPAAAGDSALGNAENGAKTYATYCSSCHGPEGKGDGAAAAAMTPKPRDFTDAATVAKVDDARLLKVIAEGGQSVGQSALMPALGGALGPDGVKDVAAFVRSLMP